MDHSMPSLTTSSLLPSTIRLFLISSALLALSTSLSYSLLQGEKFPSCLSKAKPLLAYDLDSSRKAADEQMRERVLDFTAASTSISIPKLYGISALGTWFCVYEYTPLSRSLTPLRIDSQPDFVTDTAPKERWNLDFLEPQGEARLKQVVRHINLEEMGWLQVPQVSLDFLTLRAQRSD